MGYSRACYQGDTMADAPLEDRPRSRRLTSLRPALAFLRPYRWAVVGASIALVLTASVTLSVGQGVRLLIDEGCSVAMA